METRQAGKVGSHSESSKNFLTGEEGSKCASPWFLKQAEDVSILDGAKVQSCGPAPRDSDAQRQMAAGGSLLASGQGKFQALLGPWGSVGKGD